MQIPPLPIGTPRFYFGEEIGSVARGGASQKMDGLHGSNVRRMYKSLIRSKSKCVTGMHSKQVFRCGGLDRNLQSFLNWFQRVTRKVRNSDSRVVSVGAPGNA